MSVESERPARQGRFTLIYIHGRRNNDPGREWFDSLRNAINRSGPGTISDLDFDVVAPDWLPELDSRDTSYFPSPEPSIDDRNSLDTDGADYRKALNDLRQHLAAKNLWSTDEGVLRRVPGSLRDRGAKLVVKATMGEVKAYRDNQYVRNRCLSRVLSELPPEGDAVIIAHSLGSVLLSDLIYLLPPDLRLRMIITIGSPLGLPQFQRQTQAWRSRLPYERVGPWLNLAGRNDPIGSTGLSHAFPDVADNYVSTRWKGARHGHAAPTYLGHDQVAQALFWLADRLETPSAASVKASSSEGSDATVRMRFQYALRAEQSLPMGDAREAFALAREQSARDAALALSDYKRSSQPSVSAEDLLRDNSSRFETIDESEALRMLILLAASDPVEPMPPEAIDEFQQDVKLQALKLTAVDFGGAERWGAAVSQNLDYAIAIQGRPSKFEKELKLRVGLAILERGPYPLWTWASERVTEGLSSGAMKPFGDDVASDSDDLLMPRPTRVEGLGAEERTWLRTSRPEEVSQSVALIHAYILACNELKLHKARDHALRFLFSTRQAIEKELLLLESKDQEDSQVTKWLEIKRDKAIKALSDPRILKFHQA